MFQNRLSIRYFFVPILIFIIGWFFIVNHVFAGDTKSVVFCSINQSNHRLYKISNAVLTHAFGRLGIKFQIKYFPPNRIARELNMEKIDGDTHRIYDFNRDNEYPNLIRIEEPIQTVKQCVFTKLDTITVNGWKSLLPYKIIYIKGIKAIENGLETANFPQENRLDVYDIDSAFTLLNIGRGDVVVVSPSTGNSSLKKLGLTHSGIKILSPPLIIIKLYPYMNKKYASLAENLTDELRSMKNNGQYDRIVNTILE